MDRHTALMWFAKKYPFRWGKDRWLRRALRSGASERRLVRNMYGDWQLLGLENWVDRVSFVNGGWERTLVGAFVERSRQLDCQVFLDIGAGAGTYTLRMHALPSITRVIAYEPDPQNYAQLCANLWLNGLTETVDHHRVALSSVDGRSAIHLARKRDPREGSAYNTGTTGLDFDPLRHDPTRTWPIATRRLDGLLQLEDEPIAVKIDTEGHELEVLKGMPDLLAGRRGVVLVEVFPHNLAPVDALLAEHGFRRESTPAHWNHLYAQA